MILLRYHARSCIECRQKKAETWSIFRRENPQEQDNGREKNSLFVIFPSCCSPVYLLLYSGTTSISCCFFSLSLRILFNKDFSSSSFFPADERAYFSKRTTKKSQKLSTSSIVRVYVTMAEIVEWIDEIHVRFCLFKEIKLTNQKSIWSLQALRISDSHHHHHWFLCPAEEATQQQKRYDFQEFGRNGTSKKCH